ncbi:MAG TPA: hypothetical protein VHV77_17255 [Pirellulales bacterium]|nr:hypothetical protein [Pirellulales bacterium]
MRKIALFALVWLATFVAAPSRSTAAELKPVVVMTFSGYNELRSDLDFIGQLSDTPELGASLDGLLAMLTKFQGLVGLDKTKPWGIAVSTDGMSLQNLAFIPVTDLKRLLGVLADLIGPPQDMENAVVQISVNGQPVYIKHERGWAFLAMSPGELEDLPADPQAIFGSLPKDYDVAVKANVQNVPQQYRDLAIGEMKRGMQQGLQRRDDETDAQYNMRAKMMQEQLARLEQAIKELNEITLGWSIDSKGRRALLDLSITAVPGSQTAKQSAEAVAVPSKFNGFLSNDFLFNAHCATKESKIDVDNTAAMLDSLHSAISDAVDQSDDLKTQQEKDAVKKLVTTLLDVVDATLKAGVVDGGMIVTPTAPFTIAAGLGVVGGDKLEGAFRQAVTLSKDKTDDLKVQLDADKHQGVTFHVIKGPWPANDDTDDDDKEMRDKTLGESLVLTAAFGKDSAFLALGADGVTAIKNVIDASAAGGKPAFPFQANLSMARTMDFAAESEPDNPVLGICADALEKGKDKIHLTTSPITDGARMRIEFEEGVVKVLGVLVRALQPQPGR